MAKSTEKLYGEPPSYYRRLSLNHFNRAERIGAPREYVDLAAVLRAHGLHCHLCDTEIDQVYSWKNPGNKTGFHFDHVISLSRGGSHTFDNIRIAHQWCNLVKELRERGRVAA